MGKRKWIAILVVIGVLASILGTTAILAHDPSEPRGGKLLPRENYPGYQGEARDWGMWGMMNGGNMGYLDNSVEPKPEGMRGRHGGHMGYFNQIVEPDSETEWEFGHYCFGYQEDVQSWGMHGPHFGMIGHITLEEVAGILGLTSEELLESIHEGKTIEQIALNKGISTERVFEAVLVTYIERTTALVQDGYLTQEQANYLLEQVRLRVEQLVTTQWLGYGHGYCALGNAVSKPDITYDSTPRIGFSRGCCW
jgi:hypothetical protein